jgi:hypothetical protein
MKIIQTPTIETMYNNFKYVRLEVQGTVTYIFYFDLMLQVFF